MSVTVTGPVRTVVIHDPATDRTVTVRGATATRVVTVATPGMRGPAGPPGATGQAPPPFVQATPAATWTIQHGLDGYPKVLLFTDDAPTEPVFADVFYPDQGTVTVQWPSAESGRAYLTK